MDNDSLSLIIEAYERGYKAGVKFMRDLKGLNKPKNVRYYCSDCTERMSRSIFESGPACSCGKDREENTKELWKFMKDIMILIEDLRERVERLEE